MGLFKNPSMKGLGYGWLGRVWIPFFARGFGMESLTIQTMPGEWPAKVKPTGVKAVDLTLKCISWQGWEAQGCEQSLELGMWPRASPENAADTKGAEGCSKCSQQPRGCIWVHYCSKANTESVTHTQRCRQGRKEQMQTPKKPPKKPQQYLQHWNPRQQPRKNQHAQLCPCVTTPKCDRGVGPLTFCRDISVQQHRRRWQKKEM